MTITSKNVCDLIFEKYFTVTYYLYIIIYLEIQSYLNYCVDMCQVDLRSEHDKII